MAAAAANNNVTISHPPSIAETFGYRSNAPQAAFETPNASLAADFKGEPPSLEAKAVVLTTTPTGPIANLARKVKQISVETLTILQYEDFPEEQYTFPTSRITGDSNTIRKALLEPTATNQERKFQVRGQSYNAFIYFIYWLNRYRPESQYNKDTLFSLPLPVFGELVTLSEYLGADTFKEKITTPIYDELKKIRSLRNPPRFSVSQVLALLPIRYSYPEAHFYLKFQILTSEDVEAFHKEYRKILKANDFDRFKVFFDITKRSLKSYDYSKLSLEQKESISKALLPALLHFGEHYLSLLDFSFFPSQLSFDYPHLWLLSALRGDQKASSIDPIIGSQPSSTSFTVRGICHFFEKSYDAAKKDFAEAIKLEPLNRLALTFLCRTYLQLKQFEEARRELEPLLKEKSITIDILYVDYLLFTKQYEAARKHLAYRHSNTEIDRSEYFADLLKKDYHYFTTYFIFSLLYDGNFVEATRELNKNNLSLEIWRKMLLLTFEIHGEKGFSAFKNKLLASLNLAEYQGERWQFLENIKIPAAS
jgi:tetratricopeptide (TPR) repeat protein